MADHEHPDRVHECDETVDAATGAPAEPSGGPAARPRGDTGHNLLFGIDETDFQAMVAATGSRNAQVSGDAGATVDHPPLAGCAGGRFHILRFHREGGLGRLHVARDLELGREVALKEIRPDKAAESDLRARFVLEAEINGGLEHPGIVPVYSLGTFEDGRPFYAMRFVEGDSLKEAIEAFHNEHPRPQPSGIGFRKLLGRFIDVCEAVAFAHSKGVLHRDLKPHNVMLGRFGETLLIDWGLAKATGRRDSACPEDAREATLVPPSGSGHAPTLGVLGSPQYMSPEQASGAVESLGPATDVYGLGAILFTLFTGEPPVDGKTIEEILDRARRHAIRTPRSLNPKIPRALEAICLKALAMKHEDRYSSARALADDVEHWLADEPVSAFRENFGLRLGRWARRHRAWVQAGVTALLLIATVASAATVVVNSALGRERQARAGESRALAESQRNFLAARQAVDQSFTLISEETLLDEPGLQPLRRKLLKAARAYHERFLSEHIGDRTLKRELAESQLLLADITEALGNREEALANYLACRPRYEELVRADAGDRASRRGLIKCLVTSAAIETDLSKLDQAEESLRQAIHILESADDVELRSELARAEYIQGRLADVRGDVALSQRLGQRCVTLLEALVAQYPDNERFKVDLSFYYLNVGRMMVAPSRRAEAIRMCRRACEIEEGFLRANPDSVLHRYNLGRARYSLGHKYKLAEQWGEAAAAFDSARLELEQVVRQNPTVRRYRLSLAEAWDKLGVAQERAGGASDEVIRSLRQAAGLFEQLHQQDPQDALPLEGLSGCTSHLGQALVRAGRVDEAIEWFRKDVALSGQLLAHRSGAIFALADHSSSHVNLGEALASAGRHEEAVSSYRKAIELIRRDSGDSSSLGHFGESVANWSLLLADSLHELNRTAEVDAALSEYIKLSPEAPLGLYNRARRHSLRISDMGKGQSSLTPDQQAERRRDAETAMFWLREAVRSGWKDAAHTRRDQGFVALRARPDFQLLISTMAFPLDPFGP